MTDIVSFGIYDNLKIKDIDIHISGVSVERANIKDCYKILQIQPSGNISSIFVTKAQLIKLYKDIRDEIGIQE